VVQNPNPFGCGAVALGLSTFALWLQSGKRGTNIEHSTLNIEPGKTRIESALKVEC
jgi:hypothetical protein